MLAAADARFLRDLSGRQEQRRHLGVPMRPTRVRIRSVVEEPFDGPHVASFSQADEDSPFHAAFLDRFAVLVRQDGGVLPIPKRKEGDQFHLVGAPACAL